MKPYFKFVIVSLLTVIALSSCMRSCKKTVDLPACTSNCDVITIKGIAWDKSNNIPIKGVKISLMEQTPSNVAYDYSIANLVTDANGAFYFSESVDTSILNSSWLNWRIVFDTANYFEIYNIYNSNYMKMNNYLYDSVHQLKQDPGLLELYYYPKTMLKINMHRTSKDTFTLYNFYASLDSAKLNYGYIGSFNGYKHAVDTSIIIQTTYNIPTKITTQKWLQNYQTSQPVITVDSIVCNKNGSNVFDVYY